MPSVSILGVKVHRIDMAGALEAIRAFLKSGKPHMIVTADASSLVIAQQDAEFRDIVNEADLVTPDGAGVLLGSRWLGTPLGHRVSGVDMVREVCAIAAREGFSVYFLGSAPGVAERAAENLSKVCPGLSVAGCRDGFFGPDDVPQIVRDIRDSGAKALFVAMGIPKQEKWIRQHLSELGVCVAMGVGGSFDVFSGRVKRAPVWMQRHGLEWLYRLAKNPSKISKVKTLPVFVWLVVREMLRSSKGVRGNAG